MQKKKKTRTFSYVSAQSIVSSIVDTRTGAKVQLSINIQHRLK